MEWSNLHDVPQPLAEAVMRAAAARDEEERGDYTVTELLLPPQLLRLLREHGDSLTVDVAERLNAFLGQAVHAAIEQVSVADALRETRLYMRVDGLTVSGRLDHYSLIDNVLTDWKVTSVWAFLLGPRREWEEQLNLYRLLLEENGYRVQGLQVVAILRDWVARRAEEDEGYPRAPFVRLPLPMWEREAALEFLLARLAEHRAETVRPCTDEERWVREGRWEVWSGRSGKRLRRFTTEDDARAWMQAKGEQGLRLAYAPGQPMRCLHYCPVRSVCPQWGAERAERGEEATTGDES